MFLKDLLHYTEPITKT